MKPILEHGESLRFYETIQTDERSLPFIFGFSDRAIFVSKEQHFRKDAIRIDRIPLQETKHVLLLRERTAVVWLFSALLLACGFVFAAVMMSNALNEVSETKITGYPFGMIAAGILIPFLSRGRRVLRIESVKGNYNWKPAMMVDRKSRERILDFQKRILSECKSLGIVVMSDL